jgi:general stress protein 26
MSSSPPTYFEEVELTEGESPSISADARRILDQGREATLATLRPDGWPQATIVNYVNDDARVYFDCAKSTQKARNIALDDRISFAVLVPYLAYGPIYGISLAGHATLIEDPKILSHVLDLWKLRYRYMHERLKADLTDFCFYAVEPIVVTRLHFTAGLGHRSSVAEI